MLEARESQTLVTRPDAAAAERARRAELERRLEALAASSDADFGRLGPGDAILIAAVFVLLPAVLVWICR